MTYNPTTWVPRDVISSEKLNKLENGVAAVDAGAVRKTGTETIAGTKRFTSPIYGSLASSRDLFTSFATVANNMQTYAGYSFSGTGYITDMPLPGFAMISVQPNENSNNSGSITLIYTTVKTTVHGHVNSGVITWEVSADDALVTHKAGPETITGDKTFTGVQKFTQPIIGAISVAMVPAGITTISGLVSRALTDFGGNYSLFSINYVAVGQAFTDAPNTTEQYYKISLVSRGSARTYVSVIGVDNVTKNASVSNGVLTAWV